MVLLIGEKLINAIKTKYKYFERIGENLPREGISDVIYKKIHPLASTIYEVGLPFSVTYDSLVMKPAVMRGLLKEYPKLIWPLAVPPVVGGGYLMYNLGSNYIRGVKAKRQERRK